jgi:O-antigen/teichoic acid export membrane protein
VVWGLRWSAIYVFFITISGYQMGAMAGFETFRPIAVLNGAYGVASVFLTWQLTTSFGIRGAVISQGCAAMLLWILYHFALRKECRSRGIRVSYRDARDELRVLTRFSIPSAACGIVATTAMWFCNANLAAVNGYAELAVFTALNNMRSIVLFVPALIARVTLPLLNNLLAAQHWGAYRRTFRGTVVLNGGIAVVLAGSLFVAGPQLLALFGKDFRGSRYLFAIFLGSVVLEVIANTLFQALFTAGRIWRNLGIISTWAAVLISCVMLTSRWGAAGIAFAYLSAWSVSLVLYALAAVRQCREGVR